MSEALAHLSDSLDGRLEALAAAAAMIPWPLPRERDEAACHEAVRLVDALLAMVARGHGAIDVAIGERLDALSRGDHAMRVAGCAGIVDYAREVVGMAASTTHKNVRFARELRERPLLRAAVRNGEVCIRHAEAVLPMARGENEEAWVARAREMTVRGLKAAVKEPAPADAEGDEKWTRLCTGMPAELRQKVDEAMEVAGELLGATAPKWDRLLGMGQEFLGAHEAPGDGGEADRLLAMPAEEFIEPIKEWLEKETEQWAFLGRPGPVAAPGLDEDAETDPHALDRELRRLAEMRRGWDDLFGRLALLFRTMDGARRLGFASFEHYYEERLGMAVRTVQQRVALERRLLELPPLREAMREGRISYEKARLVARHADARSVAGWIERAEQLTCVALRRELQGNEEAQMCARGQFAAWMPRYVAEVLFRAFRAASKAAGRPLSTGEALGRVAAHFVEVWKPILAGRSTLQKQILARDRGLCQVPGCSRAAVHAHHIEFRSAGGSDDPENLVSLCAAHHLRGVHMGRLRVRGKAPDRLQWELGARSDAWIPTGTCTTRTGWGAEHVPTPAPRPTSSQ